jgi:hypothetical protein
METLERSGSVYGRSQEMILAHQAAAFLSRGQTRLARSVQHLENQVNRRRRGSRRN